MKNTVALLLIVCGLVFVSCSSSSNTDTTPTILSQESLVGVWESSSIRTVDDEHDITGFERLTFANTGYTHEYIITRIDKAPQDFSFTTGVNKTEEGKYTYSDNLLSIQVTSLKFPQNISIEEKNDIQQRIDNGSFYYYFLITNSNATSFKQVRCNSIKEVNEDDEPIQYQKK